jgi:endoglucanase
MMKNLLLSCFAVALTAGSCSAQDWPSLWKSYVAGFMDNQIRVIDHDAGDRTTSEGQAYAMFFALVANDRARFEGLLHWTEANLASGDLSSHLPAWSWGKGANNKWTVLDSNSASDADVWMAFTLLEAGRAWKEPRYTSLGAALAKQIAAEEVVEIPGFGTMLLPGAKGFRHGELYRLNPSYLPLQVFMRLGHELPDGPWQQIATRIPAAIRGASPNGFCADWAEFKPGKGLSPSAPGSYDAIRVYLWAGMLDPGTSGREEILKSLSGMTRYLHATSIPPSKVKSDGTIEDPNSPVGFSAALLPYLSALGETNLESQQMSRVQSEFNSKSGLYGNPAKYYDQNLIMFALGWKTRQFWFDSQGTCVFRSASLGREPLPSAVQRAGSHLIDAGK